MHLLHAGLALLVAAAARGAQATAAGAEIPLTGRLRAEVKHRLYERGTANGLGERDAQDGIDQDGVSFGSYWFCPAVAGGQAVEVLIDTGSADLWLLSPSLPADQQDGQQLYDPSQSPSAREMAGYSFDIGYGTGGNGVSGPVYTDSFAVGPASVQGMTIGSAHSVTGLPGGIFKSGIMGLAFQSGNSIEPEHQPTFMERLQPQLDSPVFVCNFKMGGGGFIEFGGIDTQLFQGDLVTLQADNTTKYPGSWSSENVAYYSNGKELGTFDIVFDTGGPGSSAPLSIVNKYYAQIPGAVDVTGTGATWSVPCDADMPDLEFHFQGGAVGTIPGKNLIQGKNSNGSCSTWFNLENSPTRGLVGDAFFNSNVVVFDQAKATISWAPQV